MSLHVCHSIAPQLYWTSVWNGDTRVRSTISVPTQKIVDTEYICLRLVNPSPQCHLVTWKCYKDVVFQKVLISKQVFTTLQSRWCTYEAYHQSDTEHTYPHLVTVFEKVYMSLDFLFLYIVMPIEIDFKWRYVSCHNFKWILLIYLNEQFLCQRFSWNLYTSGFGSLSN